MCFIWVGFYIFPRGAVRCQQNGFFASQLATGATVDSVQIPSFPRMNPTEMETVVRCLFFAFCRFAIIARMFFKSLAQRIPHCFRNIF